MKKMKIWAHRGASGYAPENTLEAFEKAVQTGADGVELDIQLTSDGEVVVVHDEWLERVSDGLGLVKDHTLKELKALHFNKTFPECESARIPTLREVYELLSPTGLTVNVELKTGFYFYEGMAEKALNLEKEMGMEGKVLYSSFNHYTLQEILKKNPDAQTAILFQDGIVNAPEYAKQLGVSAIHPYFRHLSYPDFRQQCRELGLSLHVWTVNTKEELQWMQKEEVEAVITNYPDIEKW